MTAGLAGLLREKTRPSHIPPLSLEVVERVVARTLPGTTHLAQAKKAAIQFSRRQAAMTEVTPLVSRMMSIRRSFSSS